MKTPVTLSERIAALGMDEAREVALLNRRARYALTRDRSKVFASTPAGNVPAYGRNANGTIRTRDDVAGDLGILKLAKLEDATGAPLVTTRDYVAAWCRLNHLKEC